MTREKAAEWIRTAIAAGTDARLVMQADGRQSVFQKVPDMRGKKSRGPPTDDLIEDVMEEVFARGRIQVRRDDPE